jgi:hypothetical protein
MRARARCSDGAGSDWSKENRNKMQRKVRMLELIMCGLMGLAATLVIAFCFAFGDEFSPVRNKSSLHLINDAHLDSSPMIETGTRIPRFRGTVGKHG